MATHVDTPSDLTFGGRQNTAQTLETGDRLNTWEALDDLVNWERLDTRDGWEGFDIEDSLAMWGTGQPNILGGGNGQIETGVWTPTNDPTQIYIGKCYFI
jgi:hypothetical protein